MNVIVSHEWNRVAFCGGSRVAEPGTPVPAPVTMKLRGDDQAPGSRAGLTAWTRQKYVPFGRPLTMSLVVAAPTSSLGFLSITDAKSDDRLTSQL